MNVLDLFSGIGGFSLGLERAGMRTVAFCEIEPYQRAVLAKHWPGVPIYPDVRELTASRLATDGISVDVVCGGFPCQDISSAGKGAGLDGKRSGLWFEYARLIGELKPLFVIIENVPRLRTLGADRVLSDLAEHGYAAEPVVVGAIHAGAPHRRQRAWIVAYSDRLELRQQPGRSGWACGRDTAFAGEHGQAWSVADAGCEPAQIPFARRQPAIEVPQRSSPWEIEPDVGRVADGIPARMDRLKSLGNAVLPQIPEIIGRFLMTNYALSSQHSNTGG